MKRISTSSGNTQKSLQHSWANRSGVLVCVCIVLMGIWFTFRHCTRLFSTDFPLVNKGTLTLYVCAYACVVWKSCALLRGRTILLGGSLKKGLHASFYVVFGVIFLIVFLIFSTIRTSALGENYWLLYDDVLKICLGVCFLLFAILSLEERHAWAYVFQLAIFFSAAGYFQNDGDAFICAMFLLMIAAIGSETKIMVRIAFFLNLGLTILFFYLSQNGYINYIVSETGYGTKHAFGFTGGNEAAMEMCFLMIYFVFLLREKVRTFSSAWLVFMVMSYALFYSSRYLKGRTGVFSLVVVMVLSVFYYLRSRVQIRISARWCKDRVAAEGVRHYGRKHIGTRAVEAVLLVLHKYIIPYVYLIMAAVSFFACWFYKADASGTASPGGPAVSDMSTVRARLFFGHETMTKYVPKLFGQYIEENSSPEAYFWIDNFYVRSLYKYGILLFVIFMICMTVILRRLYRKKDYFLMDVLALLAVAGFVEVPMVGYVMVNVFPLMLFQNGTEAKNMEEAS